MACAFLMSEAKFFPLFCKKSRSMPGRLNDGVCFSQSLARCWQDEIHLAAAALWERPLLIGTDLEGSQGGGQVQVHREGVVGTQPWVLLFVLMFGRSR